MNACVFRDGTLVTVWPFGFLARIVWPLLDLGNSQHSGMHPPAPQAPNVSGCSEWTSCVAVGGGGKRLIVIHPMAVV